MTDAEIKAATDILLNIGFRVVPLPGRCPKEYDPWYVSQWGSRNARRDDYEDLVRSMLEAAAAQREATDENCSGHSDGVYTMGRLGFC